MTDVSDCVEDGCSDCTENSSEGILRCKRHVLAVEEMRHGLGAGLRFANNSTGLAVERLCAVRYDCTVTLQCLCSGCAMAVQWLCSACTLTIQ